MISECQIKSGINKDSMEDKVQLSLYVQNLESMNTRTCDRLIEIVDDNPKILYEPEKITKDTKFPIIDLALVYKAKKIIGHLVYVLSRDFNEYGYKTKVSIAEENLNEEIPTSFFDEYIVNRLKGNMLLSFKVNEKNNQK